MAIKIPGVNGAGYKSVSGYKGIGLSALLSGGAIANGSVSGYVSDAARKALGLGPAHFRDGGVHLFAGDKKILKRALVQRTHQLAYGALRSYPRFLKYWEQKERDRHLRTKSQTSLANRTGQYYRLISDQQVTGRQKNYTDPIVNRIVHDYLELDIDPKGTYYDTREKAVRDNPDFKAQKFVDLQPEVQVSSRNNIILTTVQGRDFTRKEFVSGGDFEVTINGKITSKYPDVYPEAEVSKFLKLMQYRGVLSCDNTILRQFGIRQLIVLGYSLAQSEFRNIQPYTLNCVAVEPSEAVEVKEAVKEVYDNSVADVNEWIKIVRFGTQVVDPASILKISRLWI
jgi:hypothetical protein